MDNKSYFDKVKDSVILAANKGQDLTLDMVRHKIMNTLNRSEMLSELKGKFEPKETKLELSRKVAEVWLDKGLFEDVLIYKLTVVRTQFGFNSKEEYLFNYLEKAQENCDFWKQYSDVSYMFLEKT